MTGYYIELGYGSGYASTSDYDRNWEMLKNICLQISRYPEKIIDEALRCGAPEEVDDTNIREFAEHYRKSDQPCLEIIENNAGDESKATRYVRFIAGGGGPVRKFREYLGRAVCRMIIEEAHRQNIELNIAVS